MYAEEIQNKKLKKYLFKDFSMLHDCKVSRASTEIMLDRFCNGKEIDFPFSKQTSYYIVLIWLGVRLIKACLSLFLNLLIIKTVDNIKITIINRSPTVIPRSFKFIDLVEFFLLHSNSFIQFLIIYKLSGNKIYIIKQK